MNPAEKRRDSGSRAPLVFAGGLVVLAVAGLMAATIERNGVYATELGLWADTVARRPSNPEASVGLGNALTHTGQRERGDRPVRAGSADQAR